MQQKEKVCKIKVVGIGGGGGNAINRMIECNLESIEYIAINTDLQDLMDSLADVRIQIGSKITKGQGAGAVPDVGMRAALESREAIEKAIGDADLVFVTAGMGGGTGTGAAPVVASIAKEKGIVTVGVVTKPFEFEGHVRMANALMGIDNLKDCVDTLLIIPNDRLKDILPEDIGILDSFKYADEVLRQGIRGITDLIYRNAQINLDFADIKTVLKEKGLAHMGVGEGSGENRAIEALRNAVQSPLLDFTLENATDAIVNYEGGPDLGLNEIYKSTDMLRQLFNEKANIIFGLIINPELKDKVIATVIATGFGKFTKAPVKTKPAENPVVFKPFGAGAPPVPDYVKQYEKPREIRSQAVPDTRIDADIDALPKWLRDRLKKD